MYILQYMCTLKRYTYESPERLAHHAAWYSKKVGKPLIRGASGLRRGGKLPSTPPNCLF